MYYKPIEFVIETYEQLCALGAEWVERLGLQDWRIEFGLTEIERIDDGLAGQARYTRNNLTALVKLLRHDNYVNNWFAHDMEVVLVHELLHLKFAMIYPVDDESVLQEQVIESLARTLVQLKREKEKAPKGI